MKNILKLFLVVASLGLIFSGCSKLGNLPTTTFGTGTDPVLSSSATTIAQTPADSNMTVVTFSWTNPNYATDSAHQKFILEIDSTGRNFAKEVTFTVNGPLNKSFTGAQLNAILAGFGFAPGRSFSFDIRITSSYANNNVRLLSNVITISMSSYVVPITLVPSSTAAQVLQVSNATNTALSFGWNASPYGSDTIVYALQYDTVGGKFANPQVIKYGTAFASSFDVNDLNTAAINAGVIGGSTKQLEFRIISYIGSSYLSQVSISNVVNITVTTFTPIPPNLYIVGDATPGGWNNPVPLPSQQFTRLNAVSYGIVVHLNAGGSYLFLPLNGDWTHKYGGASATGGNLLADGAVPSSNTPGPAVSGNYQIVVNFQTGTYTVTPFTAKVPTNLFIVGDATPGGWSNPVAVPSQQFTQLDAVTFGIVINLTAGGSYLLLPINGDWNLKYAVANSSLSGLSAGGTFGYYDSANNTIYNSNIPGPSTTGNYIIIANFETNTFTVTPYTGVTPVPTNLYIVGDATAGGWNNPVPVPSQQFTRVGLTDFQLTLPLSSTGSYLFLPVNGDWSNKYGGTSATGGPILYDNSVPSSNTPGPAVTGNYLVDVNFATGVYKLTKQ